MHCIFIVTALSEQNYRSFEMTRGVKVKVTIDQRASKQPQLRTAVHRIHNTLEGFPDGVQANGVLELASGTDDNTRGCSIRGIPRRQLIVGDKFAWPRFAYFGWCESMIVFQIFHTKFLSLLTQWLLLEGIKGLYFIPNLNVTVSVGLSPCSQNSIAYSISKLF